MAEQYNRFHVEEMLDIGHYLKTFIKRYFSLPDGTLNPLISKEFNGLDHFHREMHTILRHHIGGYVESDWGHRSEFVAKRSDVAYAFPLVADILSGFIARNSEHFKRETTAELLRIIKMISNELEM